MNISILTENILENILINFGREYFRFNKYSHPIFCNKPATYC